MRIGAREVSLRQIGAPFSVALLHLAVVLVAPSLTLLPSALPKHLHVEGLQRGNDHWRVVQGYLGVMVEVVLVVEGKLAAAVEAANGVAVALVRFCW